MVDAIAGAAIMVMATMSLVMAIEVAEKAFDQAGRYPLNLDERGLIECCLSKDDDIKKQQVLDFEKKLENALNQADVNDVDE